MSPQARIEVDLEAARDAAGGRAWAEAYDAFAGVDPESALGPEDLDLWAKAAWWTGRPKDSIAAHERAYAGYLERGDRERAAFAALTLRREHAVRLEGSTAKGWLARAERLLRDRPDSPVHGYLALAHAELALQGGELDRAIGLAERAIEISSGFADPDLQAWALMRKGQILIARGELEEGWSLLEEVSVAAVGGELGPYTTGAVFCNVIETSRDLADLVRGREFSDAAKRWCERQAIKGFPGVCRVRRAEIMRLLGSLGEAASEAEVASRELADFSPFFAGEALHELGEVRLRMGDLDAAEQAFREAKAVGADPQPGLALLHLARGQSDAAAASIRRSLEGTTWNGLARGRLLPASVEVARARGDRDTVAAAVQELARLTSELPTPTIRANAELARGTLSMIDGDPGSAAAAFGRARQLWREIDAPYETARTLVALGDALLAEGDVDGAALELETARDTFFRLGAELDTRAVVDRIERLRIAERGQGSTPRATRTFMFTDIVGSTALLEAIGDEAWADLCRWHDETLRACLTEHGGKEVDHTGDGLFVAFPDPGSAVSCAIEIQRRLADHRRRHGFAPQVRIGVHTAEANADGEGYRGMGVHTAARIGALAGAGEILASVESLDGLEVDTSDGRPVTLKGIGAPVEVASVLWR